MPQIEFRDNKILKLTNLLSRKVPAKELMHQEKQIQMLMNWTKAKGYETMGPLVLYNSGITGVDADGQPLIEARVMIQLRSASVRLELPYRFEKEVRIENCLMARFRGAAEKMQFATSKLTLYAYENDLELTGETYIILLEQHENDVLADVFMPRAGKQEF